MEMKMKVSLIRITVDPEELIEIAARICYGSKFTGNPKFIQNLISSGHESPLEHASASFHLENVSRTLSHQLVRHRLASVSQQSQRYIDAKNFSTIVPENFSNWSEKNKEEFLEDMKIGYKTYEKWRKIGLKKEDARFFLPNATTTNLIFTANFREFRHIFKLRCSEHAQWEIRNCCLEMWKLLVEKCPIVFEDLNF
jgi:thymidylate synthase (FAD)